MNTGLLRYAVGTVLTVYGIETFLNLGLRSTLRLLELEQCLPFTVLKLYAAVDVSMGKSRTLEQCLPFTVLKPSPSFAHLGVSLIKLEQCLPFTVLKLSA